VTRPTARVRFAVIGDVEPKDEGTFSNLRKAVAIINELSRDGSLAFTASIGDIAHRGSVIQYETATGILSGLASPFYAIMGNEELMEGVEPVRRFLDYASRWNREADAIPATSYVKEHGGIAFIFATALEDGTTFSDGEIAWLEGECGPAAPSLS